LLLPSRFAVQALVNQHFQKGLLADSLAIGNLPRVGQVRLRQAQCDLHARIASELRDEWRAVMLFPGCASGLLF